MADKHEIEGNALRAHLRQEVEFSPWLLSESLYKFNETNIEANKETNTVTTDLSPITGQFRCNPDLYRSI